MKMSSTMFVRSLLSGLLTMVGCASVLAQTPVIDGTLDWPYGPPKVWQLVQTEYGNNTLTDGKFANGSELNAAYGVINSGRLFLCITGNLESNNNRLFIFFDSISGGQNRLRGDNAGNATLVRLGDLGLNNDGFTFESGFDADFVLTLNGGFDSVANDYRLFADYTNLPTSSGGATTFLGAAAAQSNGTLFGGVNLLGVQATIDNGNTGGVGGGAASGQNPGLTTRGVEVSIPLAALGNPSGPVRVFAMITNQSGTNVSNQMLPSVGYAGGTVNNYGEPRGKNLGGATGSNQGTQFFLVEPAQSGRLAVLRHGSGTGPLQNPAPLFVNEYNTTVGGVVRTIAIPSVGVNRFVHGNGSTVESQLVRATSGTLMTFAGYNQAPNGTLTGAQRRIGAIDRSGNVSVFGSVASVSDTLRSTSTFDGSRAYLGTQNGTYNVVQGAATGNFVTSTNVRSINIFNNQLYQVQQGSLTSAGIGMPTTTSTATPLSGLNLTLVDGVDFAFADPATLYIADNSSSGGGIQKWVFSGSSWSRAYTIAPPSGTIGYSWMTLSRNSSNENVIYAVTNQSTENRLIAITDKGSAASSTSTVLATAPTNTLFRGVDFSAFNPNFAPVAENDAYAATEDTTLTVAVASGVISNDSDDSAVSGLTASIVSGPAPAQGSVVLNSDGSFVFTPAPNFNGAVSFTYRVSDGSLESNTATVAINVAPVNDAPTLAAISDQTVSEGTLLSVPTVGADPNDSPANGLTYSLQGTPPMGASINAVTGLFTWTPAENQGPGTYSITVRVTDNGSPNLFAERTFQVTVNETNEAPVLDAIGNQTVDELATLTVTPTFSDPDLPANTLSFSLDTAPAGMTVNPTTGVIKWTPTETQGPGTYPVTLRVTDNGSPNLFAQRSFQVTVNEANVAPTWSAIGAQAATEFLPFSLNLAPFASDTDEPAQTLSYDLVSGPSGLTVSSGGAVSWTPGESDGGTNPPVTVSVTDGTATTQTTFTINVAEANVAPVWSAIPAQNASEGNAFTFNLAPSASDSDRPEQTLTFAKVDGPGSLTVSSEGVVNWIPGENDGGTSPTVTVSVSDGVAAPVQTTFTIIVAETNQAPTLDPINNTTVNEGATLNLTAAGADTDVPANTLTYSLQGPNHGATINASTGQFSWTPTEAQGPGTFSFTIRVTDNGAGSLFAERTFNVTVNEVNAAPTWNAITGQTAQEGAAFSLPLSGLASDGDEPAQMLTYAKVTGPATLNVSPTGMVTWTPGENDGGTSPTVTVSVSDGVAAPVQTTFTINVAETNQLPTWTPISAQTASEGVAFSLDVSGSASDNDLPVQALTFSKVSGPASLTVSPEGVVNWTPGENDGGGSFPVEVKVADNFSPRGEAVASFTINVSETNQAPTMDPLGGPFSANELQPFTLTPTAGDPDLPAQTLTYSLTGAPAGMTINETTGAISWTPTETQGPGTYPFTVRVTDPSGEWAEHSATVIVAEVNADPTWLPIAQQSANEGLPFTFDVSGFGRDSDLPVQTLIYALVSGPSGLAVAGNGAVTWTPGENDGGTTQTVTVSVTDGVATVQTSFTISVTETNQTPTLDAIANQTVNELATLTVTPTFSDPDLPANTLTFSLENAPAGMTVNPSTGVITWTPTEAQGPNTYDVTLKVTDNGSPTRSAERTFEVVVNEVNVAPTLAEISNQTVNELQTLSLPAVGADTDLPSNDLTYSIEGLNHGATINASTGAFNWTPSESQGPGAFSFTIRVTDNGSPSLFAERTFSVSVNEVNTAPTLAAIDDQTVDELAAFTLTANGSDGDLPANGLTYSLQGANHGATIHPSSGLFSWTPTEAQGPGTFEFTLRVTDNGSPTLFAERTFTLTVAEVNQTPSATPQSVSVQINSSASVTLAGTDADLPAQSLTFEVVDAPAFGGLTGTAPNLTYTPDLNYSGPDSFTFRVFDGITWSTPATVNLNVSGVLVTLNLSVPGFLAAPSTNVTRGLSIFLGEVDGGPNPPLDLSRNVVFNSVGQATLTLGPSDGVNLLPASSNYAISVKDNLHTLRRTVTLTPTPSGYSATLELVGGNLNRDGRVDIADYVVYATRFGVNVDPNTPLALQSNAGFRHADISGDGRVDASDFSYLPLAFGQVDNAPVLGNGRPEPIRQRITVKDAIREAGSKQAAQLDLDGDGWITMQEIGRFFR